MRRRSTGWSAPQARGAPALPGPPPPTRRTSSRWPGGASTSACLQLVGQDGQGLVELLVGERLGLGLRVLVVGLGLRGLRLVGARQEVAVAAGEEPVVVFLGRQLH